MINKYFLYVNFLFLIIISLCFNNKLHSQQDPQYTQYIYNTMAVNSAYAGQRDALSIIGLYRNQWVGIDGAPKTLSFGIHSPLKNERLGLGLSVVSDEIGPAQEDYVDLNLSYTIPFTESTELSFGLKAGFHNLSTDWSKGMMFDSADAAFSQNISLFSPTIGAGLYMHSNKWYLGMSIPNFLVTEHYDDFRNSIASESIHYYFIGGYVFDMKNSIKLKPAFLLKAVPGSPSIADFSLNALFNNSFTLGVSNRFDESFSGLVGFQLSPTFFLGYAYDYNTSIGNNYTGGTHEIMLRFELQNATKILSPRFF